MKTDQMNNKLTQNDIENRLIMYERVNQLLMAWVHTGPAADQAAAVVKEVRSNRDRFIKRMETRKRSKR